jgi:hypothetical protein
MSSDRPARPAAPPQAAAALPASIQRFCLLIGTMKSGTTTLFKHLAQHPALAGSREKEPNFFSRRENRDKGRAFYEALWNFDPANHAWAMEASTDYTKLPSMPSAAYFALRFGAEFRFVYVVRDPLERIASHYRHGIGQGWIERPVAELLLPDVVAICNYHMQLWPYAHAFDRERNLVLHQSELNTDLVGVLRRVCRFLEVDDAHAFDLLPRQNTGDAFARQGIARELSKRRILPAIVSPRRLADLPAQEFEEACRTWSREAAQPAAYTECARAFERAVTPTPAQRAAVRALLRADLDRFRDDWGVDPWSAENRAALDAERVDAVAAA